jgi:diguanylate cyclase
VVKLLDEHERTLAFAEVALGQIKSLRQTAVPRNYEIWYVYATGYNAPLNKIINETLARSGTLSEADLEQIYETYLSHIKTSERIDKVGARVIGEIDDVMRLITDALGASANYDASLDGASQKLALVESRDQLKAIVEGLAKSTREMRETNKALENRLTLSKVEISNLQHSLEAIRAESLTDPLTGLGNRKYFDRSIEMAVQTALATGEPLSLLMFDIDHFKSFNERRSGAATGRHVVEADHQGPGHHRALWRRGIRSGAAQYRAAPGADGRRPHPPRGDGKGAEEEVDRRDFGPRHHLGRRFHAEAGRRHRFPDRARRRLPLRRQACRPQPGDL